jgi:carbamate kinase
MNRATRIVIALGGNALEEKSLPPTAESQLEVVKKTVEYLAELSVRGYELAVVHGNGPQVGRIVLATEAAAEITPAMPFDVCGAMSQGYIGYHIQQALKFALHKRGKSTPVVSLVTQVVVDKNDPAFQKPTKPIGPFYTEEVARKLETEKGFAVKEDAGRGWRRIVASPIPMRIVELSAVKQLFDTTIVITVGGGGIPVIEKEDGTLEGIAAVIDKDFAAGKLSQDLDADILMILTEVDKVSLNFKKPDQKDLGNITVAEAERYIEEGHFAPGSMLPKMQAAVKFAKANPGKKAIITSLYKAVDAVEGNAGTVITM